MFVKWQYCVIKLKNALYSQSYIHVEVCDHHQKDSDVIISHGIILSKKKR